MLATRSSLTLSALVFLLAPLVAAAQDRTAEACAALLSPENTARYAALRETPAVLMTARVLPAERDIPEICRVEGVIGSSVGFLLRLPTKSWNGKFMMGGCGGSCGNYLIDRIDPALVRGYAVVNTDLGRKGVDPEHRGVGWIFLYNDLQAQVDFGFRATHVTAVLAKILVADFYGKAASRNYYWGCSTGGQQGLKSAQLFADEFDGIAIGAPATIPGGGFIGPNAQANLDEQGNPILSPRKLPLVHRAVIEACDRLDGLADGVLQDPRQCNWDPGAIGCDARAGTDTAQCLTPREVEVVRRLYDGPRDARGRRIAFGMARGSEDQWSPIFIAPEGLRRPSIQSAARGDNQTQPYADVFRTPGNPDLRAFRDSGAKMILYHGWHDNNIPAAASADYYETVARLMGGYGPTREFFRFFAMPAMNHCRYGAGGGEVDWISYLENWVEKGQAPDYVIAHHMKQEPYPEIEGAARPGETENGRYTQMARFPLAPGSFDRTRRVYAYPDVSRWSGRGEPADESTWVKVQK